MGRLSHVPAGIAKVLTLSPLNEYFGLSNGDICSSHVVETQRVFVTRSLQFVNGLFPVRVVLADNTSAQFTNAIFKSATRHWERARRVVKRRGVGKRCQKSCKSFDTLLTVDEWEKPLILGLGDALVSVLQQWFVWRSIDDNRTAGIDERPLRAHSGRTRPKKVSSVARRLE